MGDVGAAHRLPQADQVFWREPEGFRWGDRVFVAGPLSPVPLLLSDDPAAPHGEMKRLAACLGIDGAGSAA